MIFSFKFRTGNPENPSDQLYDASVLAALAENSSSVIMRLTRTSPTETNHPYLTVGKFNHLGFAEGKIDDRLGPIAELRLLVHSDSGNWVILSEVRLL